MRGELHLPPPLSSDEPWQRCNPLDRRSMANHPYKTNRSLFAYSYSHLFILYPWVFQTTETRDAIHHYYLRYQLLVFLGWAHTATASRSRLISQTRGSLNTFPHLLLLLFIYLFLMIFRFMFFLLLVSLFFRYTSCIGTYCTSNLVHVFIFQIGTYIYCIILIVWLVFR